MKSSFHITCKKAAALLLSCGLILGASGCSSIHSTKLNPKEPVLLDIWHYYNGPQAEAFNLMIGEFNETIGAKKGIVVEAISQGDVTQLNQTVMDSAARKVGAKKMPAIFAAYADSAYAVDAMGLVASLDPYMTPDELDSYIPGYLEEGRFDRENALKIFPVAKSTELLMLNQTDWDKFAAATGATPDELSTIEGITSTAADYYNWTDSLTPTPNDGKAFFGRDAVANYMLIGSRQLGVELFEVENGAVTIHLDPAVMRKLWDNLYVPYIKGHFADFGRFASDDIKTGEIIAMVGSTSGVTYFPNQVILPDNSSYSIQMTPLENPCFRDGKHYAVQQGAGMVVTKSDPKTELAAVTFLKWFTGKEQNVKFSLLSGYLPVTKEGSALQSLEDFLNTPGSQQASPQLLASLPVAFETCRTHTMYTNKAFKNGSNARVILEKSMMDQAKADREQILQAIAQGTSYKDAVAVFNTDTHFSEWFTDLSEALNAIVELP